MATENIDGLNEQKEESSASIDPMSREQCSVLVYGFVRSFYDIQAMPSDIAKLCVSFYSMWLDLKLVYCDNETGAIDLTNYQIRPVLIESGDSGLSLEELGQLAKEVIHSLYISQYNYYRRATDRG